MGEFHSYREQSRANWGCTLAPGQKLSEVDLKLGALLRSADALEKLAVNVTQLQEERDRYACWYNDRVRRVQYLERSNAALRGVIKRMKRERQNG